MCAYLSPLHQDIKEILISENSIHQRVGEMGEEIRKRFEGKELVVVAVMNGSMIFVADLLRKIPLVTQLETIHLTRSPDRKAAMDQAMAQGLHGDWEGTQVLLVDAVLGTGNTLSYLQELLWRKNPQSVSTCVLLDKQRRREVECQADFVGFAIPDEFVVGYGLDFGEKYRNLPYVGKLCAGLFNPPLWT